MDQEAVLELIFNHLIEAPGDLRGIECVACEYAQRKTSEDVNLNCNWQKKYAEKTIYFRLGEILTYS